MYDTPLPKEKLDPIDLRSNTIFVNKIPNEASAMEIWRFFKTAGKVKYIILPRKKDKTCKRFSLVKTPYMSEALAIIKILEDKTLIGVKLNLSLAKPRTNSHNGVQITL